jgi:hypothetical protein
MVGLLRNKVSKVYGPHFAEKVLGKTVGEREIVQVMFKRLL